MCVCDRDSMEKFSFHFGLEVECFILEKFQAIVKWFKLFQYMIEYIDMLSTCRCILYRKFESSCLKSKIRVSRRWYVFTLRVNFFAITYWQMPSYPFPWLRYFIRFWVRGVMTFVIRIITNAARCIPIAMRNSALLAYTPFVFCSLSLLTLVIISVAGLNIAQISQFFFQSPRTVLSRTFTHTFNVNLKLRF